MNTFFRTAWLFFISLLFLFGTDRALYAQNNGEAVKQAILQGVEQSRQSGSMHRQNEKNAKFKNSVSSGEKSYSEATWEHLYDFEGSPEEKFNIAYSEYKEAQKEYLDVQKRRYAAQEALSEMNSIVAGMGLTYADEKRYGQPVVYKKPATIFTHQDTFISATEALYEVNNPGHTMPPDKKGDLQKALKKLTDNYVSDEENKEAKEKRNKKAASFNAALDLCPECAQSKNLKKAEIL